MPYIRQEDRMKWDVALKALVYAMEKEGVSPGDLNYMMTQLAYSYVNYKGLSYTHLNDVKGVFAAASDEFTRRIINNYEDQKIQENGDLNLIVSDPSNGS